VTMHRSRARPRSEARRPTTRATTIDATRAGARRLRGFVLLAAALAVLAAATDAAPHGDPASHYLETEPPLPRLRGPPVAEPGAEAPRPASGRRTTRLPDEGRAHRQRGRPDRQPELLGQPQRYAELLASELGERREAPVLVVSPHGFGVAGRPPTRLDGLVLLRNVALPRRAGGNALAAAAMVAVRNLAQSDGHPLPARVPPAQVLGARIAAGGEASDDGGTGGWLTAGVLTLVLVGALLALGARSLR
jgi:hypothetical protein